MPRPAKAQASLREVDVAPIPRGQPESATARHEVYRRMRQAILDVQMLPGAPVSEHGLAAQLNVSRTPVREAIQRLASEELLQVIPQVGTRVARIDLARIRDALFMREAVESEAVARMPMPLGAGAAQRLQTSLKAMEAARRASETRELLRLDEEFHQLLLTLAGHGGVWRYVLEAREMHRRVRILAQTTPDAARASARQHHDIVDALVAGRPAEAARTLREHIRMNLALAEQLAQAHPAYFTLPGAAPV